MAYAGKIPVGQVLDSRFSFHQSYLSFDAAVQLIKQVYNGIGIPFIAVGIDESGVVVVTQEWAP